MIDLYYRGGLFFMSVLSILLIGVVVLSALALVSGLRSQSIAKHLQCIKHLGLLALSIGLLGQLIGLFSAFRAIKIGEVESSSTLFLDGFKISMIPSIYGLAILIIALAKCWVLKKKFFKPVSPT